ncbi:oxidoreductase [Nocardia sp. MDA0666]|uniref:NADPH:quinone reductase n=1 Tax=Nocardia sp. MDA0666 TaxID=2135448 RepID=UPI000D11C95A|nr:NADPH:quinone reductase [Nocardia sp. MDA0666]PSR70190.1 oxidoreductase [Nocardia sp. MDA0666]
MAGIPDMMYAAYVEALGPADAIHYGRLPVPQIGPTDVLVAVHAVTVDPVDTFVRSGTYATPTPFPFIIGRDLVGNVAAVGDGAVGYAVGDAVWCNSLGHGGRQGSFAQYAVVPVDRLYHLPDGVDPVQAVGVAHPAATAWLGLFRHARLGLGDAVYIGGGAGNVGDAAVRLARAAGARVIASASGDGLERVRDAGAAVVVDYRDTGMVEQIRAAAPQGLDVYWDTSGHHDIDGAVGLLARGGRLLLTAAGPQARVPLPVDRAYTHDVTVAGFAISNATVTDLAAAATVIDQKLADRTLTARIADTMPLARAAEAHHRLEKGGVRGRLILMP